MMTPSDELTAAMLTSRRHQHILRAVQQWWTCSNPEPLIGFRRLKDPHYRSRANQYWPADNREPDYENLVAAQLDDIQACDYFGCALPTLGHWYGSRGTPMTMAFYLGGNVRLDDDTVWVDPVITNLRDVDLRFDENNPWLQRSIKLLQTALRQASGKALVWLPDLGDALTCLSLLRGTEPLLMDIMDDRAAVKTARDNMISLWFRYHQLFWDMYRQYYHGDSNVLCWAPGKTNMCQCDFSTMLSSALFRELIVPELDRLSRYLDYIVWHMDGPEELQHLDTLLDLPYIRAIQWMHGAGNPGPSHWLDMLKKIQRHGKALYLYAMDQPEIELLVRELEPAGLRIDVASWSPHRYDIDPDRLPFMSLF